MIMVNLSTTVIITLLCLWIFKLQLRLETTTEYLKVLAQKVYDFENETNQILEEHMAEITDIKEMRSN